MATKKAKAVQQQGGPQITEAQKALISLMEGVKSAGLGHPEAQLALQTFGADAGAALGDLVQRGFAFQMGNGLYALARGADGRYAYQSGGVPMQAPQPPPPPAQPPPVAASTGDHDEADGRDEDPPYGSAFEQEMRDRLDAIDLVLRKIMTAMGIPGGAPVQPVAPPAPPPQQQPPLQQWGAPQQQQQPPAGYMPMPPQAPQSPSLPWDGAPAQPPPYAPPMPPQMQQLPPGYPQQGMPPPGYPLPAPPQQPNGYPPGSYGYQTPGYPPRQ